VRRALDLDQGARLQLTIRDDHMVELMRPRFARVADLASMPPARRVDLSPEQMRSLAHEDRWREKEVRGS
jgi:bifunctional DNA-binding transcriptional regulator/antitoxin component of YhaV-PrlF toxin-antitoxin module